MTPEKKQQLKELRERLKALSPAQRQLLLDRGLIATIEGRTLSAHNTIMVYFQSNGRAIPTVVGGFKQWREAGRTVMKGEHGLTIWFPVGQKDEEGELIECERFYTGTVFDISQTKELEKAELATMPEPDGLLAGLAQSLANKLSKPIAIEPSGLHAEPVTTGRLF